MKNTIKTSQINYWTMCLVLALTVMIPDLASASPLTNTICVVIENLQGDIARGIAAVSIIFLGFSLFLGKVTWGVALATGMGIGAIFGAGAIVNLLGTDNAMSCSGIT